MSRDQAVERAIAALRTGRAVRIDGQESLTFVAIETATPEMLTLLDPDAAAPLLLSGRRAAALSLANERDAADPVQPVLIAREAWLDFVFRIRWSRHGDSSINAFLNGQKIFRFDGPLGYRNEIKGPYLKLGVYASGQIDAPLVAYHDNYSRADSFEAVDPSIERGPTDKT